MLKPDSPQNKYLIFVLAGFLFVCAVTSLLILTDNSKTSNLENVGCYEEIAKFDEYVSKSKLEITDTNSLCYGLNINSNFKELEPKWAIAKFTGMRLDYKYALIFEGINNTETINIPLSDEEASSMRVEGLYKIDMNNICRNLFAMADSRMPSPVLKTFHKPEPVNCK